MTVCISATFFLKVSLSSASMGGLIASLLAGELQLRLSRSGHARLRFDAPHRLTKTNMRHLGIEPPQFAAEHSKISTRGVDVWIRPGPTWHSRGHVEFAIRNLRDVELRMCEMTGAIEGFLPPSRAMSPAVDEVCGRYQALFVVGIGAPPPSPFLGPVALRSIPRRCFGQHAELGGTPLFQ
jgi:hypothetical protein